MFQAEKPFTKPKSKADQCIQVIKPYKNSDLQWKLWPPLLLVSQCDSTITTIIINLVFLYPASYHILSGRKINLYFQAGIPKQNWVFIMT